MKKRSLQKLRLATQASTLHIPAAQSIDDIPSTTYSLIVMTNPFIYVVHMEICSTKVDTNRTASDDKRGDMVVSVFPQNPSYVDTLDKQTVPTFNTEARIRADVEKKSPRLQWIIIILYLSLLLLFISALSSVGEKMVSHSVLTIQLLTQQSLDPTGSCNFGKGKYFPLIMKCHSSFLYDHCVSFPSHIMLNKFPFSDNHTWMTSAQVALTCSSFAVLFALSVILTYDLWKAPEAFQIISEFSWALRVGIVGGVGAFIIYVMENLENHDVFRSPIFSLWIVGVICSFQIVSISYPLIVSSNIVHAAMKLRRKSRLRLKDALRNKKILELFRSFLESEFSAVSNHY